MLVFLRVFGFISFVEKPYGEYGTICFLVYILINLRIWIINFIVMPSRTLNLPEMKKEKYIRLIKIAIRNIKFIILTFLRARS